MLTLQTFHDEQTDVRITLSIPGDYVPDAAPGPDAGPYTVQTKLGVYYAEMGGRLAHHRG